MWASGEEALVENPAARLASSDSLRRRQAQGLPTCNLAFCQSPFPPPESLVAALRHYADAWRYLPAEGLEELRKLIVEFHEQFDHLEQFCPGHVLVGPGAKQLLFLATLTFDGAVFVATPSWPSYLAHAQLAGRRRFLVAGDFADAWKLTPPALEAAVAAAGLGDSEPRLLVMCNPDNPSGQSYSAEELQQLADCLRRLRFVVVSDETHARLQFNAEFQSLAAHLPEATVVVSSFSKWTGLGGWRLGYALFPEELAAWRRAATAAGWHTFGCAPAPAQYAAVRLLNDLHTAETFARHCRRLLAAVGDFCHRRLAACPGVRLRAPSAGFCVFVDFEELRDRLPAEAADAGGAGLCDHLLQQLGVALVPGEAFHRPRRELTARLSFVDFDGRRCLAESRRLGLGHPVGDDFVLGFCNPAAEAVVRLADWLAALSRDPDQDAEEEPGETEKVEEEEEEKQEEDRDADAPASQSEIEQYSRDLVDDVILIAQAEWVGCRI